MQTHIQVDCRWSPLPSPGSSIFYHPLRGITWVTNRLLNNAINEDDHYKTLVERQMKAYKVYDTRH